MNGRRWAGRAVRVTGSAALAFGLAAGAVATAGSASAAVTPPARGCCHLLTESAAAGWGNNFVGQLGNGTSGFNQIESPDWTAVSTLSSGVVQVSGGNEDSLALTSDGSVWAWGGNLGSGSSEYTTSNVPVQVPGLASITEVSAGAGVSLALRSDGTVWSWGDNSSGDLGDGNTRPSLTPVPVTGLTGVTQISAGQDFALALRSDGTVWSWGFNADGELGNGTISDSDVPVQVTGLSRVTDISAGENDSLAVASRGLFSTLSSVYEWGANGNGQLGDGSFRSKAIPEQVTGIGTQSVSGIAAGGEFSMVLGSDGTVWDWGVNTWGQLGDGNTYDRTAPVEARGTGSGITQISAGDNHALALLSNGTVEAWGYNGAGQLGDGSAADAVANPAPVQVTGLGGVTQISAGSSFSLAIHQVAFIQLPGTADGIAK